MKESLAGIGAFRWMPESLITKCKFGFRSDSEVKDGSDTTIKLIDELAMLQGSMLQKIYALYSSGVAGYEGKIFSPKQILSMAVHNNSYKPEEICKWTGGIRTENGIVYGPSRDKKQELLEKFCIALDEWSPEKFNSIEKFSGLKKEKAVYLVANYAQFVFLLIHPFWNRNGRISEEVMQLFCAQNSTRRLFFWQNDCKRYNEASDTRMKLINSLAQELLKKVLNDLGVQTDAENAVTKGYKKYFLQNNPNLISKSALAILSPYHYRFISDFLSPKQSKRYFLAIEEEIDNMINKLKPESFSDLSKDEYALRLLGHHLSWGHSEKEDKSGMLVCH